MIGFLPGTLLKAENGKIVKNGLFDPYGGWRREKRRENWQKGYIGLHRRIF